MVLYNYYYTERGFRSEIFTCLLNSITDHEKIAELLIEKKANISKADREHKTPLHIAVSKGKFCTIKLK